MTHTLVRTVTAATRSSWRDALPAPDAGEPRLRVSDAMALPAGTGTVEVYIDWQREPIEISYRARFPLDHTWERSGPLLITRVKTGIQPLLAKGWRTDGSLNAALRWDTEQRQGQAYLGCWVRLVAPLQAVAHDCADAVVH